MPAKRNDPLRSLSEHEKTILQKISRSLSLSADQVARAKELLAVAEGKCYQQAASLAGRKSNDAVAHLVSRFNQEGLSALQTKHAGGPAIEYTQSEKDRILREFQRQPDRTEDATANWTLVTLQRALRAAPDGLAHVSTYVIWQTLHQAGLSWQIDRSWCQTGQVKRRRKSGPVEVMDPDAVAKKNLIEQAYAQKELPVFNEDEAGPYQTIPYPGRSWQLQGEPRRYPHEYLKAGTAKMLTLFEPKSGQVWVRGVISCTNPVLHGWLIEQLTGILQQLPSKEDDGLLPYQRRAVWESWQAGLTSYPRLGPLIKLMPPLRALLIMDNLSGHHTPSFIVWLFDHGIMPLFTPLGGSWLNMAESIQRILKRRGLEGHHPQTPQQIITWLEQAAAGWNKAPTPFEWGGKRRVRRQRLRQKSWQRRQRLGGSGAYALQTLESLNPAEVDRLSA